MSFHSNGAVGLQCKCVATRHVLESQVMTHCSGRVLQGADLASDVPFAKKLKYRDTKHFFAQ